MTICSAGVSCGEYLRNHRLIHYRNTTFSLEFVWGGLKAGERIIYISLEEAGRRILYMEKKRWDVEQYLNKSLFIIKLDPTDFNLANNPIKNELPLLIRVIKASGL